MNCVIGEKAHEARVGFLCLGHFERLGAMLRDIEDEAAHLDARPSMQQRVGLGGGGLASEQSPARLEVLAFRDPRTRRWEPDAEERHEMPAPKAFGPWCLFCDHETCTDWRAGRRRDLHDDEHDAGSAALASVLEEVHNWARLVREERGLSAPERVTLSGERDLLTRHLEWVAAQPWVDEAFGDLRAILGQLRSINGNQPDRPAGSCYLAGDGPDGTCGGTIWRLAEPTVAWRVLPDRCVRGSVEVADGPARCDKCGTVWDGAELHRLNLILEERKRDLARPRTPDGRAMKTAEEIMREQRLSRTAFDVRAHRARKTGRGGRCESGYYDPADFERSNARAVSVG